MNKIRYLLDEHVSDYLRKAVRKYDNDVIIRRIGDTGVPAIGTSDPEILIRCETDSFCLVTNNRKTMPGIFVINPNMTMSETAYELALIAGASEQAGFTDMLIYLPITGHQKKGFAGSCNLDTAT